MTRPYPVPVATEEPLGSVTRVLALSEAGGGEDRGDPPDVFTGACLPQLSGRIYGGQVVAQGMLAAAATLADDGDGEPSQRQKQFREVHLSHSENVIDGLSDEDGYIELEDDRDGRRDKRQGERDPVRPGIAHEPPYQLPG